MFRKFPRLDQIRTAILQKMRRYKQKGVCIKLLASVFLLTSTLFLISAAWLNYKKAKFVGLGENQGILTVRAEETIKYLPNQVDISVYLAAKDKSPKTARQKLSILEKQVLRLIDKYAIPRQYVDTQNYNLSKEYSWEDGKRIATGFKAYETIKIKVQGIEVAKRLVNEVSALLVENVTFDPKLSDADKARARDLAIESAIQKAKDKAQNLANLLGVRLQYLVDMQTTAGVRPYPLYKGIAQESPVKGDEAYVDLPTGEKTDKITVILTYKVLPK